MRRGVLWVVLGSLVLAVLAGCKQSWLEEREPWRREAEVDCLKSGTVKESPAVAMLSPINGPGMCGADFPMKIAALGESNALGYEEEAMRPPGAIPQGGYSRPATGPAQYPANSPFQVNPSYPHDTSLPPLSEARPDYRPEYRPEMPAARSGAPRDLNAPLSITPPGVEPQQRGRAEDLPPSRRVGQPYPAEDDEPRLSPPRSYPAPVRAAERPERFEPLPRYPAGAEPVPMSPSRGQPAVTGAVAAAVTPAATLACPVVSALDRWISEAVQPAARKWFNQPVVEIKQISAYSCRGMNGQPGAKISEHAFGNALDVAGFVLGDGHRITVKGGWKGTPEEQGFLHDVQLAACELFTTVLAPGSNVYHYDHIHVDLMRRASGRRICQPAAIPGDVVASRARSHYANKADGSITGSITPRRFPSMIRRLPDTVGSDEVSAKLPLAIAGED